MFPITWSRLGGERDSTSVTCDENGPKIGPIPLLKRTRLGFEPRPTAELDFVFGTALGRPVQFASKGRALRAVADALEKRDLTRAMLITQFMWLPTLPDRQSLSKAIKAEDMVKAGFNPEQPRDERGQWTNGASAEDSSSSRPADPNIIPVQGAAGAAGSLIPFLEGIEPIEPVAPTPPFPGEILPPAVGTPDIAQPRDLENPFPKDRGCREEWDQAFRYCTRLAAEGKLGVGDYKEHGKYFQQCVRGQVSERCGGNPVDWGRRGA